MIKSQMLRVMKKRAIFLQQKVCTVKANVLCGQSATSQFFPIIVFNKMR